jgi:anti-sigma factor RsiW
MRHDVSAEMTCAELLELVTDYFEGALPDGERTRFDEHLAACANCQAHIDQLRRTIDLLGRLPQDALSAEAETDLLHAFRDWKQS